MAHENALSNLDKSLIWVIDTILLVIDVPTFVPITMGMAFLEIISYNLVKSVSESEIILIINSPMCSNTTYLTGITPAATSPTIIEVTVEELCISTVAKMPSIKPGNSNICSMIKLKKQIPKRF